jgi:hypothetical protein
MSTVLLPAPPSVGAPAVLLVPPPPLAVPAAPPVMTAAPAAPGDAGAPELEQAAAAIARMSAKNRESLTLKGKDGATRLAWRLPWPAIRFFYIRASF